MAVTGLESMKGDGMGVFARANRLQVESTVVAGDAGDGSQAQVSGGRLLTSTVVTAYSGVPTTNYLSGAVNVVDTLASRSDRFSVLLMNTGSSVVHLRVDASDPSSDDLQLAPGEKLTLHSGSEVRLTSFAAGWSVAALEFAAS